MFKTALLILLVLFSISCSDSKQARVIVSYSNDNSELVIPAGTTSQIEVYANYSDGSQEKVTTSLIWLSSDANIATVDAGLVKTSLNEGNVTIRYETVIKLSDGTPAYSGSILLEVKKLTLLSMSLSQSSLELFTGATKALIASGYYDDNVTRNITNDSNWSSSNETVATVVKGLVEAKVEGEANITVSYGALNASSHVVITKAYYTSLSIFTQKTLFNVGQSIQLEVRGVTQNAQTVILNSSLVNWSSQNSTIIDIGVNGLATAKVKGDANITVSLKEDNSLSSSIILSVKKDKYLRIFRDNIEVEFPYVQVNEYVTLPSNPLASYTLRAVGEDFVISDLNITDVNETAVLQNSGTIYFDGLLNNDTLLQDTNVTFKLMHDDLQDTLHYFFKINDSANSQFSDKYIKVK